MPQMFPDVPHWTFDVYEVSAGVYEVKGKDIYGHIVGRKGIEMDLEKLIDECKIEAKTYLVNG